MHPNGIEANLSDIQGNTVRGYSPKTLPQARFLFLDIPLGHAAAARRFVAELATEVTVTEPPGSAESQSAPRPERQVTLNVAFTYPGLQRLGVRSPLLTHFSRAFQEGMVGRWDLLADPQPSGVAWRPDLCLTVFAPDDVTAESAVSAWEQRARAAGLEVNYLQRASRLFDRNDRIIEHFGFADGISQPPIEGMATRGVDSADDREYVGRGVYEQRRARIFSFGRGSRRKRWRPVKAGEFIFGYPSEGEETPPVSRRRNQLDPELAREDDPFFDLLRNGTHMVWRKLEQDVGTFRRFVAAERGKMGVAEEYAADYLKAKMVGRWADGTPLAVAPTPEKWLQWLETHSGPGAAAETRFSYHDDPEGVATPLGSHIRRTHPRDTDGPRDGAVIAGDLTRRRRMLRRGITYGPPLPEGVEDDTSERGMIFIALVTNIAGQFELVQRAWVNSGDFVHQSVDRDPLVGRAPADGRNQYVIPGPEHPKFLLDIPNFVSFRRGDYFFVPARHALEGLGSGQYG